MTNTTALYQAHVAADTAMRASDYDLDLCRVSDAAYAVYLAELGRQRALWNAIPECDAKASAVDNACDTEGTDEDELRWFEIALMTYEINMGERCYGADGNEIA